MNPHFNIVDFCSILLFIKRYFVNIDLEYNFNGFVVYPLKLKNKILRRAEKSSITQAAKDFGIGYNTVRLWLLEKEALSRQKKPVSSDLTVHQPSIRQIKKRNFKQLLQSSQNLIFIKYKKNCIKSTDLPGNLLIAYNISTSQLNFCYTYENTKSNKMLYLIYLSNFYRNGGLAEPCFITEQKLSEIVSVTYQDFTRSISYQLNKHLKRLNDLIVSSANISELLVKSFIFLTNHNLSLKIEQSTHPPFVLEDNLSGFDFNSNSLIINTISEKNRLMILKLAEKFNQVELDTSHINSERLLKIYSYFSNQNIQNKQLENRIIQDVITLQRTGDLGKSEQLIQILMKHKAIDPSTRNHLYLYYGMHKFRSCLYKDAYKYYRKFVQGCRKTGEQSLEFEGLVNLCSLLLHQGLNKNAYRYLRLSKSLANRLKNDIYLTKSSFISGYYFYTIGEYDLAANWYKQAAEYAKKCKSDYYYNYSNTELANSYIESGRYKKALKYAKLSLLGNLKNGLKIPLANSYYYCAKSYFFLKEYALAKEHVIEQLKIMNGLNSQVLEFYGRGLLVRLELLTGNKALALDQFSVLKEIIFKIENPHILKYFSQLELFMTKSE